MDSGSAGPAGEGPAGGSERPSGADERRTFLGALKWAFAMNWGQRALGALFTFVLAAILGPYDFGVVAIALVYIALAHVFLEQGFATAIIQRDDLESDHLDSAFWLNLVWCLILAGVTVAVSGWWAEVNGAPVLQEVLSVLSLLLVIEGLNIVQQAYLQRKAEFKKLAIRTNVAALVGGVLGLALALAGAGVWSLVAQQLAMDATALVLIWILSPWRPGRRFSRRHARELLGFSTHVFVANFGGFVNRRADALLIGVFFGPAVVGVYRLADRFVDLLLDLTMRPVGLIALPLFSRLQRDRENLRAAVETCLRVTLVAAVPALLVLAACGDFLLGVMGSEWSSGVDALKLLAVAGIGKAVISFTGPLLFAVGRPAFRAVMLWLLGAASAAAVAVVAGLLETASDERQIFGVAASRAVLFVLVFVPVNLIIVRWLTGFGFREFARMAAAPTAAGVAAIAVVLLLRETTAIESAPPIAGLAVAAVLAVATAVGTLLALDARAREYARRLRRGLASSYRPSAPSTPGR
ncbi:MAG TPA: lipopolysaccharide biosynthesis protein [Gaiellaceae bacterium]|nr:lipopolysaccharide biosynthesis protein [Gaiellaceae bacterium]